MEERIVKVPTPDGPMETFITHPERNSVYPVVVIYMDIWGVREELFDAARRVATVGYYCVVPDLYHRLGHVRHDYRNERGQAISTARLDAERLAAVRKSRDSLTDAMAVADTAALLQFITRDEAAHGGAVGSIGYCMGGRHVFRVATAFPDRFKASASLHGTHLVTDKADSPHRSLGQMRGELYCGFGEKDMHAAPPVLKALEETARESEVQYTPQLHKGADHGYALPERDVFHKAAANRDWENIFAMFRTRLAAAVA
jgi:carboxymethylenebutenolidase